MEEDGLHEGVMLDGRTCVRCKGYVGWRDRRRDD